MSSPVLMSGEPASRFLLESMGYESRKLLGPAPACSFDHNGQGPRCCRAAGHKGPHLFRCSGPSCPGLVWPASVMAHPYTCNRRPR